MGRRVLRASILVLLGVAGCTRGSSLPDASVDGPPMDAFVPECDLDAECDDGIPCTHDRCAIDHVCVNAIDHNVCQNDSACDGVELCDPSIGCTGAAAPLDCTDLDPCTLDRCDEATKLCVHAALDQDGDGEADFRCPGGTDCDDRDPNRAMALPELCGDGVDDDCDESIDEAPCGRPAHDVCDDPLVIAASGRTVLDARGVRAHYGRGCGDQGRGEVVLRIDVPMLADVRVRARGPSATTVSLRDDCDDVASERACAFGFAAEARARSVAQGPLYVLVATSPGDLFVDVAFEAPSTPPVNETCASAASIEPEIPAEASLAGVTDDVDVDCGFEDGPDLFYLLDVPVAGGLRDLVFSASAAGDEAVAVAALDACGGNVLRCARGIAAGGRIHGVPPGTYVLVVEGEPERSVDFALEARLEPASTPPGGDTCAAPIPLPLGVAQRHALAGMQDDLTLGCGRFAPEMVFAVTLDDASDLEITVTGDGAVFRLGAREVCDDPITELRCVADAPVATRIRGLAAGTYFVFVESVQTGGFEILAERQDPTTPTPVAGNETCGNAFVVPAGGGLFTGDTRGMANDYETRLCGGGAASPDAVFRVDVTDTVTVRVSTDGSGFDTVLHHHLGSCDTLLESACDDDGGTSGASALERTLQTGAHFFVVDGFGRSSSGPYVLEIETL